MAEDDDIAAGTPQSSSNHRVNSLGDVPGLQCRLVSHAHNEQDEGAATPTRTASTNEEHIREAPLFHLAQPPCASPRSSSPDANHGGLTTSLSISHPVVKFLTTLELQGYASYIIHENQLDTMELLSESASSADLAAKLLGPTSSHRQQAELSKGLQRWIKQQQREEAARQREAQRAGAAAARKGGRRAKKIVAAEDVVNGAAELLPTADPNHDRKRGRGEEEEGAGKAGDSSVAPSARTFRRENETATQFMRKLAFPGKLPPPASPPTQGGTQSIPIDVDAEEDEDDVAPAMEDALMRWMQQEEHPAAVAPQDEDSHRPALPVGSPAQTPTNTESAMSSALLSWLSGEDVVDRHVSCSRDPLWLLSVGLEQRQAAPILSVGAFASAADTTSALEAELADIPDPTRSPAKTPSSPASAEIPSETSLPPQSAEDLPIAMRLTYSDHEDEIQHSPPEVSVKVEERVSELQEDLRRNMTALLTTYQEKMDELLLQGNGKDAVLSTHTSRLQAILQPMRDDDEERVISRVWMVGHSSEGTTTTMEPSPLTCESRLLPSHLPTQAEMVDAQLPSSQLTSLVRSAPPVMHTSADCHLKDREDEAGISNHQDDGDDDWWDQLGIEGLQPTQNTFDDVTAEDSCNMTIGRPRGESPSILPANISSVVVEAPLPSGEDDSLLVATQHIATRDVAHMGGKAMMSEDMKSDALNHLLHLYHSQKLHSLPAEEVVVLCASLGLALHEHTEEGVEAMRSALLHTAVRGCFFRQVAPQCLHRLPRFSGLPYYPVKVGDLLAAHDDAPRAEEQWATLRAEATMDVEAENRRCILASVFATSVEAIEKQCCTDDVGSLDGTTLPLGGGENEEAAHTAESSTSAPSGMFECTPALTAGDAMLLLEPVELESLVALVTRDFPHLSSSKIKSALQESGVVMSCVRHLPQTASPLANTTRTRGWGSGSPHRVRSPSRSRSMTDDTVPLSQAEKVQERKRLFFATRGMPTRRGFIGRGRARGRGGGTK